MPITVDGVEYPSVRAWNLAMDEQARVNAPAMLPSASPMSPAAPQQSAVTDQDRALNPNTTFREPQALPVDRNAPTLSPPGQAPPTQVEYDAARNGGSALPSRTPPQISEPTYGARGTPPSGIETVQSEPTPQHNKHSIDPRPYAWLAENNPRLKSTIDEAAKLTGVSPERLAWTAHTESRFNPSARGAAGEVGMMQFMPATAKQYSEGGRLNPADQDQSVLMAALYMRDLDAKYGKDSFLSVARYNGSGDAAYRYAAKAFSQDGSFNAESAIKQAQRGSRGGSLTPQDLVRAGTQGGPEGFLRYSVQTAPSGMPLSDVWRHAEAELVTMFIRKGDLAGAQHAKDFVLQMSHAGSNQYLMSAHQALSAGDGIGAAHALAKAHAFFPDGTVGRFKSDGRNVYAERLDENDPSKRVGPRFQVTPDGIASLLNLTRSPQQFLKTLNEQQKATAEARYKQQHGDYYATLTGSREAIAAGNAAATVKAAEITADATRAAAAAKGPNAGLVAAANRSADETYSTLTNPDMPIAQRGLLAELHKDAMLNGATPPQAERVARGLSDRTLQLIRLPTGAYGVVTKDNPKQPIAYLSQQMGDRLTPQQQPQAQQPTTPVGAGAAAVGTNNNLSSALPVGTR